MLTRTYRFDQFLVSKGWIGWLLLIALTVGLGTQGFALKGHEHGEAMSFTDALYCAFALLDMHTGHVAADGIWQLEVARWCGTAFWASAVTAVVIRLFRDSVNRSLVKLLASDHIIVAGLGRDGWRLVEALRSKGRTVVVIEADRNHPAVEQCREMAAIVLFGEPDNESQLLAANLQFASELLALFVEERECVRIATAAYRVLHSEKATTKKPPVRCVLRLTEPGLLDVVRRHRIKTASTDRINLEILNSHEIAATTMVREAKAKIRSGEMRKMMILGLGTYHRLGEMVVLRAMKDHFIANDGRVQKKLEIHVFDKQSVEWLETFRSRYPFVDQVCTITAHLCWARKVGAFGFDQDYDVAFICIPNEGHATAQAVMLRRDVLRRGEPIMVRVLNSQSGYGELIGDSESGWGENIHAVGLEDSLYDPDTATKPELELRAQTIHHEYRANMKGQNEPANKPWSALDETFREANRELAKRYTAHLTFTDGTRKTKSYRLEFHPDGFTRVDPASDLLFHFSEAELESLAEQEHNSWKEEREKGGWSFGPVKDAEKKTNPLLVEYTKVTDEKTREYNRDFIRSIPRILALADYVIVNDKPRT
jgi:hypothetical protein